MPGTRESKELENKPDALPLGDAPKDGEIRTRDSQIPTFVSSFRESASQKMALLAEIADHPYTASGRTMMA